MPNSFNDSLTNLRVGLGYDNHRFRENPDNSGETPREALEENLTLMNGFTLGGIEIPYSKSIVAHSDGDVLFHALIDAFLGASSLGDIGSHFPDSDPKYKNINSEKLLRQTLELMKDYRIINIDATIILEKPKLAPYINQIKNNLFRIIKDITKENIPINLKAKTNEKQDSLGENKSLACYAVTLLLKR